MRKNTVQLDWVCGRGRRGRWDHQLNSLTRANHRNSHLLQLFLGHHAGPAGFQAGADGLLTCKLSLHGSHASLGHRHDRLCALKPA